MDLLGVWAELVEYYHGVNGFGGTTTEIYEYMFRSYTPEINTASKSKKVRYIEIKKESDSLAAQMLVSVVVEFCVMYGCTAFIDKLLPAV